MAEAVAAFTIKQVINRLLPLGITEIGHILNVGDTIGLLETAVERVQTKLDRLNHNTNTMSFISQSWEPWVREATKLCYDIDDIIDLVKHDIMKNQIRQPPQWIWNHLSNWFPFLNEDHQYRFPRTVADHELPTDITNQARDIILSRFNSWGMPRRIPDLVDKLNGIENHLDSLLGQQKKNNNHDPQRDATDRGVIPRSVLPLPPGRQEDKAKLKQKLMNGRHRHTGVCIIGMFGLGKTNLALSVATDPQIRNHFKVIWWVPSQVSINQRDSHLCLYRARVFNDEPLKQLMVVDDLGVSMLPTLRDVPPQTTLLITTCDQRAVSCPHVIPYYLKRMSDKDCGELIRREMRQVCFSEFDRRFFNSKVGSIARQCMGLPLFARCLGIALADRCSRQAGAPTVAPTTAPTADAPAAGPTVDSVITEFEQADLGHLLRELIPRAQRFNHPTVPLCLNKMLSYFTLFSHDRLLSKADLLRLWIAEGFIKPETWSSSNQAEQYFDQVLPISSLEPHLYYSEERDPSTYQTNDVAHWFSKCFASNLCSRIDTSASSVLMQRASDTRHLSLCFQNVQQPLLCDIASRCKGLRTLMLPHKYGTSVQKIPYSMFKTQNLLRVLDLSHSNLDHVPKSIKYLQHLRYLDLSYTLIKELPNSICKLFGLRILKLIGCNKLVYLPEKFEKLVNLTHLELTPTDQCSQPRNVGKLICLQTLFAFCVSNIEGYRISELKYMNALKGSIKIMKLENIHNKQEAADADLQLKPGVRSLELEWTKGEPSIMAQDILDNFKPHKNLVELKLQHYNGAQFPQWMSNVNCQLHSIYLHHCPKITKLPQFWRVPLLKILRIDSMPMLISIGRDFYGDKDYADRFVSLECLEILNMQHLKLCEKFVSGDMPNIKTLKFHDCPMLKRLPSLGVLTSLRVVELSQCPRTKTPELPENASFYF